MVFGILGRNQRNLSYIKKLNPKKHIRLVDNKYKLKNFLSKRGIPVAKTFAYITDRKQLLCFNFSKLSSRDFVVKPNKGSKGKGISIIHRLDHYPDSKKSQNVGFIQSLYTRYTEWIMRDLPRFPYGYKTKGQILSDWELKSKLLPIIEGNYTLTNKPDTILIEEKLVPGGWFEEFCEWGLADIRVIVCNLVPVAAMLRMPTENSAGLANLAQGGVGMGIDIAKGIIKTLMYKGKLYHKNFPAPFKDFYLRKIPFWDDILLYSSNAQYFVNLGYIGMDRVITAQGPKMLEVNGKAWLEIQNITLTPLQKILHKIYDLDITSTEKGVEIAKSLFHTSKPSGILSSKVLFLSQGGTLRYLHNWVAQQEDIVSFVKTNKRKSYASLAMTQRLGRTRTADVILWPDTILKKVQFTPVDYIRSENRIELGTDAIKGYYIKPVHKSQANTKFIDTSNIIESEIDDLQILDRKLYDISKRIVLSKYLFPTNYLDEFDRFVGANGKYNPQFTYRFPTAKELTLRTSQLQQLRDEHKGIHSLKSPFAQLFYQKFHEVSDKIQLLWAYKKQDLVSIAQINRRLYGDLDDALFTQALIKMQDVPVGTMGRRWHNISWQEVLDLIHEICRKYGIVKYKIRSNNFSWLSRLSVAHTIVPTINLNPRVRWKRHELIGQLEHEIGVHLLRGLHGRETKRMLLEKGTSKYLIDEEWLAIYRSEKAMRDYIDNYSNYKMYIKYVLVHQSEKLSFAELAQYLMDNSPTKRSLVGSFKSVLRLKKGIKDTSITGLGTTFLKDKIYLDGYNKIIQWIEGGNDINQLMIGKVTIEDLEYIL